MNEIPDDQEVAFVVHLLDHFDFGRKATFVFHHRMAKRALLRKSFEEWHALRKTFACDLFEIAARCVALGNLEFRERVGNALDLDVAARGDIHGAGERVGKFAENSGHFLGGLEVKLVGGKLHAIGIAHGLAGLDAEQDFLGMRVTVMQIVAIVRSDQGDAGFFRQADQVFVHALLDFQALVLNFKEEVALAEYVPQAIGILAGEIELFIHHGFSDRAAQAGGKGYQSFAVLGEQVQIDAWLVIKTFQKSGGDQLDQVVIALEIFAEQNQVVAAAGTGLHFSAITVRDLRRFLSAFVAAAFGDVDFAADDGLDVALRSFIEKVRGREQIAVIRDGHGRHLLARGFVEKFGSFARAVQKAEIRMNVEMNKLGIAHGN